MSVLEQIMAHNDHIIEEFSWVTAPLNQYDGSWISKAGLNCHSFRSEMDQEFHGIMPNYFDTTIPDFTDVFNDYEGWDQYWNGVPFTSALSLGEQLYTPRGSQGAHMMAYAY